MKFPAAPQHNTPQWSGRRLFSSVSGGGEAANNDDDDNDDTPVVAAAVAATEATLSPSALHFPD